MAIVEPIRVEGLRELQAALKAADGESQKQLRVIGNDAADVIVTGAQGLVPRRSGRARSSIKARSGQRTVVIAAGGGRAPHYPWLDFGGSVGRGGSVKRPFLRTGRYLYPTFERRRGALLKALEKGLEKIVDAAGMEVR